MKEITVRTTGKFLLVDRHTRGEIGSEPVTVPLTPFVAERIGTGDLEVVAVVEEAKAKEPKAPKKPKNDTPPPAKDD